MCNAHATNSLPVGVASRETLRKLRARSQKTLPDVLTIEKFADGSARLRHRRKQGTADWTLPLACFFVPAVIEEP